jgi:hypothetical protein
MKKSVKIILLLFIVSFLTASLKIDPVLAIYDSQEKSEIHDFYWINELGVWYYAQRLTVEVGCDINSSTDKLNYTDLYYCADMAANWPFPVFGYLDGVTWYRNDVEKYRLVTFQEVPLIYDPDDITDMGRNYTSFYFDYANWYQIGSAHLYMPECLPSSVTTKVRNDVYMLFSVPSTNNPTTE